MFTLWYTVLSWREYRGLNCQKPKANDLKENKDVPTVPTVPTVPKKEISRIPEPVKPAPPKPPTPVVQIAPPPVVQPPPPVVQPPTPPVVKPAPAPTKPLAPSKIPRAPSPHVNTEAFEDDFDFEEDEDSDAEEDDEDSVVGSPWKPKPTPTRISPIRNKPAVVNDFLNQERGESKPPGSTGSPAQISRTPSGIPKPEHGSGEKKPM